MGYKNNSCVKSHPVAVNMNNTLEIQHKPTSSNVMTQIHTAEHNKNDTQNILWDNSEEYRKKQKHFCSDEAPSQKIFKHLKVCTINQRESVN